MAHGSQTDVLKTVEEIFSNFGRDEISHYVQLFRQQMDELAQLRRFRLISEAMNEVHSCIEDSYRRSDYSVQAELLASQVDLHPKVLMEAMHLSEMSPEGRLILAKSLVDQGEYSKACMEEWFEDKWRDENEQAIIVILNGMLSAGEDVGALGWAMTSLIMQATSNDNLEALNYWLIQHADTLLKSDRKGILGDGLFLSEALRVYDRGHKALASRMLPNALDQAEGLDLLRYEEIIGRSLSWIEAKRIQPQSLVTYALTREQDCSHVLEEKLDQHDLVLLQRIIESWAEVDPPIVHDRLQSMVSALAGNNPVSFMAGWKKFRQELADKKLKLSRETLADVYGKIFANESVNLSDACEVFFWAKKDKVEDTLHSHEKALKKKVHGHSVLITAKQTIRYFSAYEQGLGIPKSFFAKILKKDYLGWVKAEQKYIQANAPKQLIEMSESLSSDKLMHELGL